MLIHFWGVRGSLPTPLTPQQIQSKIMAAVQRITVDDLKNEEARAKFVSSLPSWIFGTAGVILYSAGRNRAEPEGRLHRVRPREPGP